MKGFIFSSEIRRGNPDDTTGKRDTIIFYGTLEDGRLFSWTEDNPYNIIFLRENQSLPDSFFSKKVEGFRDYLGNALTAYFCFCQKEVLAYARSNNNKIPFLETNISPVTQFLLLKKLRGAVQFLEEPTFKQYKKNEVAVFHNAAVKPASSFPKLRVLSFDIETGMKDDLLYSIALYGQGYQRVIVLAEDDKKVDDVVYVSTEKALLERFFDEIYFFNPHVITGWYINGFDFSYLCDKAKKLQMSFCIGSLGEEIQSFSYGRSKEEIYHIPGRVVIDGLDIAKQLIEKKPENMRLETVAHYLLGQGKSINKQGKEKVDEITRMFYQDKKALAHYNLLDAKLVYDIVVKLGGMEYCQLSSSLSGVLMDRLNSHNEIFTSVYLKKLHTLKIASFQKQLSKSTLSEGENDRRWKGGFYDNTVIFSLKELFLFVIVFYGIDPLAMISVCDEAEKTIVSPKGFSFHKDLSLMKEIVLDLVRWRKKEMSSFTSFVEVTEMPLQIKVINGHLRVLVKALLQNENSFSVGGIKNAIRENAFYLVEKFCDEVEKKGLGKVIYADCDRLVMSFAFLKDSSEEAVLAECKKVADFIQELTKSWCSEADYFSIFQVDEVYKNFFMADHRITSLDRSVFRYDGKCFDERYRSNDLSNKTLPLVKRFQRELQSCFFDQRDPKEYILQFKKNLFAGKYDQEIFLSKKLSKNFYEYVEAKDKSPHVQAAFQIRDLLEKNDKILNQRPTIEYYHSEGGGVVANRGKREISAKPDYNWYLESLIFPVASKILMQDNDLLNFVKNKDSQLDLFSF